MILDRIVELKKGEVAELRRAEPLGALRARAEAAAPARDFRAALTAGSAVAVIAELKRRSPSAGVLREEFDAGSIAASYAAGGAAALSVVTDEAFFGGQLGFVAAAGAAAGRPVLRKDFLIDEAQVYESRAAGADAVLLIVRILSDEQLGAYRALAEGLGMAALVEVHDAGEAERAVGCGAGLIGINNRDLDTLEVDLGRTAEVAGVIPGDRVVVSESGIASRGDVESLAAGAGIDAVLVGASLLRRDDLAGAVRELTGVPRQRERGVRRRSS